jgi:CHAD domain-containing protein
VVEARGDPRIEPDALARELELRISSVAGSVDDVIAHAQPSPESLHELHKEMRRLRNALDVWRQILTKRDATLVAPLEVRLKRLARLVGRVRDRDVMLGLIEGGDLPPPQGPDAWSVARLRARLRDDARTGRELLRVYLRSERDAHLFEGLRESVEFVPRKGASAQLPAVLEKEDTRQYDEVRNAHKKARRRPTTSRLHRLRIEVRKIRHLGEVRGRLDPRNRLSFPHPAQRLQTKLGHLHDLDLVLDALDPALRSSAWGQALRKERRRVRRSIRKTLRTHRWPRSRPTAKPRPTKPVRAARS